MREWNQNRGDKERMKQKDMIRTTHIKRRGSDRCRRVIEQIIESEGWSPEKIVARLKRNTYGPFSNDLRAVRSEG